MLHILITRSLLRISECFSSQIIPVLILIPSRPQHESGFASSGDPGRSGEGPVARPLDFLSLYLSSSDLDVGAFTDRVGLAASCSSRASAAAVLLDRLVKFFGSSKKATSERTGVSAGAGAELQGAGGASARRAAASLPPMISAARIFLGRYSVRGNSSGAWCERSVCEQRGELARVSLW